MREYIDFMEQKIEKCIDEMIAKMVEKEEAYKHYIKGIEELQEMKKELDKRKKETRK